MFGFIKTREKFYNMPNLKVMKHTLVLKAVLLWSIFLFPCLCLADNVLVTGVVNYQGVIPGATYVWALEANGSKSAEYIIPDGNGTYSLSVPKGKGYDFKVFVDGSQNGYPTTGEVWKHYADWNSSLGGYNLTHVDANLSGVDFNLTDQDSDGDGFLNWHEYQAGTQDNNASSTPLLNFGLVAHWKFDETNGTVLHDSSGNEINGTMHGFTNPWSLGRVGGAFRFDGVDDYISFPGANQLDDLRPLSFSGWLKLDQNGSGYVIGKRSLETGYWRFYTSGLTNNWFIRKTSGIAPTLSTSMTTPFNKWQHVAFSWTGLLGGQNSKMYLDGTLVGNVSRNSGAGDLVSDVGNLFTIGNRPQNNSSFFKGWMDDFRLWNRVITSAEVQSVFDAESFTVLTDANFKDAVELWFSHEANASSTYGHIQDWNISSVTDLSNAFEDRNTFNEDISKWDTASITKMNSMFKGASEFNQDIGDWNTSSVTTMLMMFHQATIFNQDISDWNISSVISIKKMFYDATSFNQSLSSWDVNSVTSMNSIFNNGNSLSEANKGLIHSSFSTNSNWTYDWSDYIPNFNSSQLAYYPLDGNASDMSGNENHGSVNGVTLAIDRHGVAGKAYRFDGTNDRIVASGPWPDGNSSRSISAWYKASSHYGNLFTFGNGLVSKSRFSILLNFAGNENTIGFSGQGNDMSFSASGLYGAWNHVIVTYDGSVGRIYLNASQLSGTFNYNLETNGSMPLVFGSNSLNRNDEFFDGVLDDLRIYNRALSATEVATLYSIEAPSGNSAPSDLNSTSLLSITENQSIGTLVGEFNATDSDINASLIYHLVNGTGDTHNHLFVLSQAGKLRVATTFDYESNASSYYIRVRARDEYNASVKKAFIVTLLNQNEFPIIHSSNESGHSDSLFEEVQVSENSLLALEVNGTDPDGDILSYAITAGADKALFTLNSATGSLKFKVAPDYENPQDADGNNTYEVWFRAIDGNGGFDEKRLTVRITDISDEQNGSSSPSIAVISGTVNYTGILSGNTYVQAYDSNLNKVAEAVLPSGSGNYSLNLPTGQSYHLRAFVDADGNGTVNFYIEPIKIYGEWNETSQKYMRIPVSGNLNGIDFTLGAWDADEDGFDNFQEYIANTGMTDSNSTPGLNFGLVGKWRLDEAIGMVPKDSSITGNDGSSNTDENSTGVFIEIPHHNSYASASGTISFWTMITSLGQNGKQGFFSKDAKGRGAGGHLSLYEENGTLTVRLQSTNLDYILEGNETLVVGQWIHITFMWGRTGMSLYQDGELVASHPYGGGLDLTSGGLGNSESIIIGAGSWKRESGAGQGIQGFLQGQMGAVRLYNRKIIENELAQIQAIGRNDANQQPIGIDLNGTTILENQPAGTIVGKLFGMDGDNNSTLSFSRVDGIGSRDNNLFRVGANQLLRTKAPLDFEVNSFLKVRLQVTDEHNASYEKAFVLTVLNDPNDDIIVQNGSVGELNSSSNSSIDLNNKIENNNIDEIQFNPSGLIDLKPSNSLTSGMGNLPIVYTINFELEDNGTHRFGGRILTDGGSEILEVGVLISRDIRFSEKNRLTSSLKSGNKKFRIKLNKLEAGTRYYYRAYARNKVGETMGSIRKLMTAEKANTSDWWAGIPEVGEGWRKSDWFGSFRRYEGISWIYHAKLGWCYVETAEGNGIWLWQRRSGWLWSQKGVWPFLYSHRKENWLYFAKSVGGRPIFYDYGIKDYWY